MSERQPSPKWQILSRTGCMTFVSVLLVIVAIVFSVCFPYYQKWRLLSDIYRSGGYFEFEFVSGWGVMDDLGSKYFGLEAWVQIRNDIKSIDFDDGHISDRLVRDISGIESLEELHLRNTQLPEDLLAQFPETTKFDFLMIYEYPQGAELDLKQLSTFGKLKYLGLIEMVASDANLQQIGQLSKIEYLWLPSTNINSSRLKYLIHLPRLKFLRLNKTEVDDTGLKILQSMASLTDLDLAETRITNEGLKSLVEMKNLETLNLSGTVVTDKGLSYLSKLTNLRFLDLTKTLVTPAGVKKLQKQLPKCDIQK